jgi:hypothetical protein
MSVSSMSSIGGGSAASSPSSAARSKSKTGSDDPVSAFASLMQDGTPYDEVKVDLPNGMSVGIVHFGGDGFDASALKSIEDFVQHLANRQFSGSPASSADQTQNDGSQDMVGIDKIHVDLPNGISFEVLHSSGNQTMDSAAIMKELTEAAEELAESFAQYSPASTAASAYATRQAMSAGPTNQVDART